MRSEVPRVDRRALVTGVTGQDGFYLSLLLMQHGWQVWGGVGKSDRPTAREAVPEGVELIGLELSDANAVNEAVKSVRPARIFHLAAQSHVPTSWETPAETIDINTVGTLRLIEAMRRWSPEAHFVLAGSSDCFDHGAAPGTGLTLGTPYRAATPYALSKLAAIELARRLRESRGLRISIAILMNHTSPRRPLRFVERKIVSEAVLVSRGEREFLTLGDASTRRDWSWAEDIVEALRLMSERPVTGDYVLGSGELRTTGDWVRAAFNRLGLNEASHLRIESGLVHALDPPRTFADIRPARAELGWSPRINFADMVDRMIEAELSASPRANA